MSLIETSISYIQRGSAFHLTSQEARTARQLITDFDSTVSPVSGVEADRIVYTAKAAHKFDKLLSEIAGLQKES